MTDTTTNYDKLKQSLNILISDMRKLHDILDVAQRGLNVTQAMPNAAKILYKYKGENDGDEKKSSLENIERVAEIAKKEIDAGFPFLYSQSAIMLYSFLEGAIKRFIITYFQINDLQAIKELANIKITFSEYFYLDENEKLDYLFVQYEKSLTTGMQYGINRFENLLAPIDFSGKVSPKLSKSIFELSQIRNVILHRSGIADKQFIKSCPWLNYSIGATVSVTSEKYEEYYVSICEYVIEIAIRLGEKNGKDMSEFKHDD